MAWPVLSRRHKMATLLRRGGRELASPFVVIAESNSTRAARSEEAVRSLGLAVCTVVNGADALALVLRTPSPALLLANALLPRVDGESVVRYMRAGQIDVPAILLGDSPELVARLRGLRIPDTDVRSTDVDLQDLRAAVSRMVARAIERDVLNRRCDVRANGGETRARWWRRKGGSRPGHGPVSNEAGDPLSVALFSVDRLKCISDQYGQTVGDQMLAEVEQVIARLQRASDIAIRWDIDGVSRAVAECRRDTSAGVCGTGASRAGTACNFRTG